MICLTSFCRPVLASALAGSKEMETTNEVICIIVSHP
jgi:hypothetical protein